MSIIKVNIPGDAWIDAKAGENVIAKLGYERLSWIRVVTERPVDLTIKTQTGDDRRTTGKEPSCNCFATEKNAQYSNPVSYTHLDVYKRQVYGLRQHHEQDLQWEKGERTGVLSAL